jgi:hypothetical protein
MNRDALGCLAFVLVEAFVILGGVYLVNWLNGLNL